MKGVADFEESAEPLWLGDTAQVTGAPGAGERPVEKALPGSSSPGGFGCHSGLNGDSPRGPVTVTLFGKVFADVIMSKVSR